MNNFPDNPQDVARDMPVEDYGGDSPNRWPPSAAAPPDLDADPEPADDTEVDEARDALLENAPVQDYGGNSRDSRPDPTG